MNIKSYRDQFQDLCCHFDAHYETSSKSPFSILSELMSIADQSTEMDLMIRARKNVYRFADLHNEVAEIIVPHIWLCKLWDSNFDHEESHNAFLAFEAAPEIVCRYKWTKEETDRLIQVYEKYASLIDRPKHYRMMALARMFRVFGRDADLKQICKEAKKMKYTELDFSDHYSCGHCLDGDRIVFYSELDMLDKAIPLGKKLIQEASYCNRYNIAIVALVERLLAKEQTTEATPFINFLMQRKNKPFVEQIRWIFPIFWYYTLLKEEEQMEYWKARCEEKLLNSSDFYSKNRFIELKKR